MHRRLRPFTALVVLAAALTAPAPALAAGSCGPLDVAFVVDDSTSMIDALATLRAGAAAITADVAALSGGDYRMGLVTFKDDVLVRSPLVPGNQNAMTTAIAGLYQNGGLAEPNASDEALNTVVNSLAARPGQTDGFTVPWRSHATRVAVLLTNAPPSGFDGLFHDPDDLLTAHQRALDANAAGVKISSVYVATPSQYSLQSQRVMRDYADTTGGTLTVARADGQDVVDHVRAALASCERSGALVRDHVADVGAEPHALDPVWTSPDIAVCPSPTPCAGGNPVAGATNYVFVRLTGTSSRPGTGTLELYSTPQGGAALWPTGWTPIGKAVNAWSGTTVMIPWPKVPGPGHFCLLARWVSGTDPMAFAEGPDTMSNTRNNNNIAWHNVDSVFGRPTRPVERPFRLANPFAKDLATAFRITQPEGAFAGDVVVDLGPELFTRWREAGSQGDGVEPIGETSLRVVDPVKARVGGLRLKPDETADLALTFTTSKKTARGAVVRVNQTDQKGGDLGGVEFRFTTG